MQKIINIHEVNLGEDYCDYLRGIGELFQYSFKCRWQTLPLQIQIVCGGMTLSAFRDLLKKKPHLVNIRDDFGRVMLMLGYHSLYKVLLECGADPNAKDCWGNSVLVYQRNHPEAVRALIRAGADVNAKNKAGVPVISFFIEDRLPIEPLLEAGAVRPPLMPQKRRPVSPGELDNTCAGNLYELYEKGLLNEVVYLHEKIYSGCYDQKTFVWLVSLEDQYSKTKVEQFTKYEKGFFLGALKAAANAHDQIGLKRLISNMENCIEDKSLLFCYVHEDQCILNNVRDADALELLLSVGADPNQGREWKDNKDEPTLLYQAIEDQNHRVVKLLLGHGADPNTGTSYMDQDDTCIACTIRNNDLESLKLLIDAKADLDFSIRDTRSPVVVALLCDNLKALKMLVDGGATAYPLNVPTSFFYHQFPPEICDYYNSVVKKNILPIHKGSQMSVQQISSNHKDD